MAASLIDLHLHTTASDGTLDPVTLVKRAHAAGVRTLSVTDHDTMAGVPAAAETAAALQVECLPGVEISAVLDGRDVHVLAYFLDPAPPGMTYFLEAQRAERVTRARRMAARLETSGVPIGIDAIIDSAARAGQSVARPALARALVDAGHARSQREAFDRWLGDRRPAFVRRSGYTPAEVAQLVSRAGGISALAHPGLLRRDRLIPRLANAGLTALEAYHPHHGAAEELRYRQLAERHGLAVSGGSDYHGDEHHRAASFGNMGLPRALFIPLLQRLLHAHGAANLGPPVGGDAPAGHDVADD